ncbi:3-demethylubiquinone-9 3-O-methyltransferase [bacterium]|nr:3-demethylubiquinone-9 3-O-methyltransferase [bacterium]
MNNLQQYSDLASQWWESSSPFQDLLHLNPTRFELFDRFVSRWMDKQVLDLGCGGGFVAEELARRGAQVVGVDPAVALIEVAKKHAAASDLSIEYRVGNGELIPAEDASFDVAFCVDVLEHVADLEKVLREVHRVLKPGGLFLYDTINKTSFSFFWMILALEWISGRIPRGTHDWRKFIPPVIMAEKLTKIGFNSLQQTGVRIHSYKFKGMNLIPQFCLSRKMNCVYLGVAKKL